VVVRTLHNSEANARVIARRRLLRFSKAQLTSTKILSQRSAVPAVISRVAKKPPVSYKQKGKLLQIARRARRGPFKAIIDPTEFGAGSALIDVSEAVKKSGKYDIWEEDIEMLDIKVRRTIVFVHPRTEEDHEGTLNFAPTFCNRAPRHSHSPPRRLVQPTRRRTSSPAAYSARNGGGGNEGCGRRSRRPREDDAGSTTR
jgi:hypothetical protein